ncbi:MULTISPECIES: GreA/GreB family elongation factor [Enorma]|uniref:GreA/GreB family elongation factor n=1 Tax=Enorma TaxID=1472762 RepID=UPI00034B1677|nr:MULTISPECIES: transcription elongation factor GreA [Enorma]
METPEFVLTSEGRQKLVDELAWREGDLTKEIVERIKAARDFGDLSENSEYDDAREEQAKNAARIAEIRAILANAKEAEDTGHTFTVSLGCVVELVDENGEVSEVTIVGSTETDSLRHRISNESPIGRAIINHAENETVEVQLPSGKTRTYTITKISR